MNYAEEGKKDLEGKFQTEFNDKYSIKIVEDKSSLDEKQKEELLDYSLKLHTRNLIINKAIHVESILDSKLRLSNSARANVNFHAKFLVFQSQFLTKNEKDKFLKKQIQILQQIRNILAHTESAVGDINISDDEYGTLRKTFWKISIDKNMQNIKSDEDKIKFTDFDHLAHYISSIDNLCCSLKQAIPKLEHDS